MGCDPTMYIIKRHKEVFLTWTCNSIEILGILDIHWHTGYHDGCKEGWPMMRIRDIRLFGWSVPFWGYYTS